MRKLLYVFSLLALFSCNQNEVSLEDNDAIKSPERLVEDDGVVYPSTKINVITRVSFNDNDMDWVNGSKVTLPNGEKVDFPWVDGGSLPFFMQQKLSPDNGWELIAHTMSPDTQSNRSYLLFHNYITGTLRVFCYMSTFVTNNHGYWKISFSEPNRLLNFTGEVAIAMDEKFKSEIVVSNSTTQDGKGFAFGWNGFQLELAYDPDAMGIMKIEPMNVNTTEISMSGDYNSTTVGTIISNSSSPSTASDVIAGIGKMAGSSAEKCVEAQLPFVSNIPVVGKGLLSLVKGGITSVFSSFAGLFDKQTQEVKDINITTSGSVKVRGTAITQTAAPIASVNIHIDRIDGKLGSWNIEEKPNLLWCTTVYNDSEANRDVTDREYFYETPGNALLSGVNYQLRSNPKANIYWLNAQHKFIKYCGLTYKNGGNMEYGGNAIYSRDNLDIIYDNGYNTIENLTIPCLRVRICVIECPTSENLPYFISLPEAKERYTIREYAERQPMNVYFQITCHSDFTINGVVNEYFSTRMYECKNDWGDAY